MGKSEWASVLAAILLTFVVSALGFVLVGDVLATVQAFVFAFIVIGIPVVVRKVTAHTLDANVEHSIWRVYNYGLKPGMHFKKEVPFGLILPLFFSVISLGILKVMTLLTYETRALKYRAAKRFGFYSYTSMTDWHHGLIGAAGIVSVLLVALAGYSFGLEFLFKMASYYAFWNMIPVSKLDGAQIFFGNRIVWSVLAVITLIFTVYAVAI